MHSSAMKLPSCESSFHETKKGWVLLEKLKAVGGSGGLKFDSGCNPSGIREVFIGYVGGIGDEKPRTIHEIQFLFEDSGDPSPSSNAWRNKNRHTYDVLLNCALANIESFAVETDDSIVKVHVWSDGCSVNAIQFFLKSGIVSELFGIPKTGHEIPFSFERGNDAKLVGVHGFFGNDSIRSIGFAFATMPSNGGDDTYNKYLVTGGLVTTSFYFGYCIGGIAVLLSVLSANRRHFN